MTETKQKKKIWFLKFMQKNVDGVCSPRGVKIHFEFILFAKLRNSIDIGVSRHTLADWAASKRRRNCNDTAWKAPHKIKVLKPKRFVVLCEQRIIADFGVH